jgi:hypothetical protein
MVNGVLIVRREREAKGLDWRHPRIYSLETRMRFSYSKELHNKVTRLLFMPRQVPTRKEVMLRMNLKSLGPLESSSLGVAVVIPWTSSGRTFGQNIQYSPHSIDSPHFQLTVNPSASKFSYNAIRSSFCMNAASRWSFWRLSARKSRASH